MVSSPAGVAIADAAVEVVEDLGEVVAAGAAGDVSTVDPHAQGARADLVAGLAECEQGEVGRYALHVCECTDRVVSTGLLLTTYVEYELCA